MRSGLARRPVTVAGDVWRRVVEVDVGTGGSPRTEGEGVSSALGPDVVLDDLRVFVGVGAVTDPVVDDLLHHDVGVTEELGERLDEQRALTLDPTDPGLLQQVTVGDVDEDLPFATQGSKLAGRHRGEPLHRGLEVRRRPHRPG